MLLFLVNDIYQYKLLILNTNNQIFIYNKLKF